MSDVSTAVTGSPADVSTVEGEGFVSFEGERLYRIADVDRMPPFLMALISGGDQWMYVSSRGGLTAGRVGPDFCIFPYETDDKLHRVHRYTGPATAIRYRRGGGDDLRGLWRPFAGEPDDPALYALYKNATGSRIVFEAVNEALGLTLRYRWAAAGAMGLVRTVTLDRHDAADPLDVEVIDGVRNVLPAGAILLLQQRQSCLINSYTRAEIEPASGLAAVSVTSQIIDRAEPAESLTANVAWAIGPDAAEVGPSRRVTLDPAAFDAFCAGGLDAMPDAAVLTGRRPDYLVGFAATLQAGRTLRWRTGVDAERSQAKVVELAEQLREPAAMDQAIDAALAEARADLHRLLADADAFAATGDELATAHHTADVLFNIMRGGVFVDDGRCDAADFRAFVRSMNRPLAEYHAAMLDGLPETLEHERLLVEIDAAGDPQLSRLGREYLPLTFSRRHGDPSRPWNIFAIHVRDEQGRPVFNYQGNWRDIFQNWQALCHSFPSYLPSVVARFVNASTMDGYNPYRVTRQGIDWEVPDPDDPWAGFGYWGDHQVVYLMHLLEAWRQFAPGAAAAWLDRRWFTYAAVPYRIKPYPDILHDRWDTIVFDEQAHRAAMREVDRIGGDGRLVLDGDGQPLRVSFAEKLIVPVLAKLANLVPGGGIWMNTQRPEWNDANNALVGNGLSMVTTCQLHRHATLLGELFETAAAGQPLHISRHVVEWLDATLAVCDEQAALIDAKQVDGRDRKRFVDAMGRAFSAYRQRVYADGPGEAVACDVADIRRMLDACRRLCAAAIAANRRDDGLYHSYNLLQLDPADEAITIGRLSEMLEGQVAAIGSGLLEPAEAADLVDAMYASDLYRPDQKTFTLYPARQPAGFFERNIVPADRVEANPLLRQLVEAGPNAILVRDAAGVYRFGPTLANADRLRDALDELAGEQPWRELVQAHRDDVLDVYERVFAHSRFTGRSASMFGYEGIGSVYWHMVAKLLVALQHCAVEGHRRGADAGDVQRVVDAYRRVQDGLGFRKTARQYGAFVFDPYSHTPAHAGAQQPGMTGQVKEEIINRWAELGVRVEDGRLGFHPAPFVLEPGVADAMAWRPGDPGGEGADDAIDLRPGDRAFTCCGTPVVYRAAADFAGTRLIRADGSTHGIDGAWLDPATSERLFARRGQVKLIEVAPDHR